MASSGDYDASLREHQPSDGFRRVHWRTSARLGRLMVRLDEQPERAHGVPAAGQPQPLPRRRVTFERAVSIAASIGSYLMREDHDLAADRRRDPARTEPTATGLAAHARSAVVFARQQPRPVPGRR